MASQKENIRGLGEIMFELIPKETDEIKESRAGRDCYCFSQGKDDAIQELPRQPDVHYTEQRDIDCYNMGYSSGEYTNDRNSI